ncbi:DUF3231 family protein [Tumebacillus permanentifrigoris]|uniref:Uncharacterized protein DUF3231 n=1 Tax=Tumebacillus permanentifrigoris TaxID=378543 RepID=A0A316D3M8_9BACL|nr:DUF3231 family protein [Tumebacillus permanentifrigoris]PWK05389.1 uncharacterized protein DUF3231 [Tumebacillus permanentifrigoris]
MTTGKDKKMTEHNIRLTSAEIGHLWSLYISDTMSVCTLGYFLKKLEDAEILPVLEYALHLSKQHLETVTEIFTHESFPIPIGFTDADVDLDAPRLFSDTFILNYLKNMSRIGLAANALALSMCARSDVRDFYVEALASTSELYTRSAKVQLSKGLYIRPPYISIPKQVSFIEHESFMSGLLGKKRPLTALEVASLWVNSETNTLGRSVATGFSQVAKSKNVRQYMVRARDISAKHVEVFHDLLNEEMLPAPQTWDSDVLDSTHAPFSDKLMMYHIAVLSQAGFGNYGIAASGAMRRDLGPMYARLIAEVATFADDGMELMIENRWVEEPPQAENRNALAGV